MLQVNKKSIVKYKTLNVIKKNISGWLIMAPTLILFAFFVWEPLLASIRLSLYSAKGMRTVEFVGFKNYMDVFQHPDFLPAVRNTFYYTIWSLIIGFFIPIIMAIIINEMIHFKLITGYFPTQNDEYRR